MPIVDIKGVGKAQFPEDMPIADIRNFLRNKYSQQVLKGESDLLEQAPQTIEPYQPTLSQKMGQGVADALYNSGVISDRYGAQRIGSNVTAIGEMLPGIGDATAGDELGRAMQKGDYGDAALAGIGALPVVGDMAIFAGALAKNANLGALRDAKALELQGKSRDEIWSETGWFNDRGDWKFEIDDSKSAFDLSKVKTWSNPDNTYSYQYDEAKNIVDHPELFNQYPNEGGINMRIDRLGAKGSYDPDNGIMINKGMLDNNDKQSTALHELQHAVQQREGFQRGGNPSMADEVVNDLRNEIYQPLSRQQKAIENSKEYENLVDRYKNEGLRGLKARRKAYSDLGGDEIDAQQLKAAEKIDRITRGELDQSTNPNRVYQRLAGEAEARLVQTRMNMTPEQRRARPPWQDLDVPEDELIYRKDSNGVNQSLPMDEVGAIPVVGNAAKKFKGVRGKKFNHLYKDDKSLLNADNTLSDDYYTLTDDFTDNLDDAGLNDFDEFSNSGWVNSTEVDLDARDKKRVLDDLNSSNLYHGSPDENIKDLELKSNNSLFLTHDRSAAEHYAGGGKIYEQKVYIKEPFFVETTDLTADMEHTGLFKELTDSGYDSIVPLDKGDIVILDKSAIKPTNQSLPMDKDTTK